MTFVCDMHSKMLFQGLGDSGPASINIMFFAFSSVLHSVLDKNLRGEMEQFKELSIQSSFCDLGWYV
jgi:hypothetical protein